MLIVSIMCCWCTERHHQRTSSSMGTEVGSIMVNKWTASLFSVCLVAQTLKHTVCVVTLVWQQLTKNAKQRCTQNRNKKRQTLCPLCFRLPFAQEQPGFMSLISYFHCPLTFCQCCLKGKSHKTHETSTNTQAGRQNENEFHRWKEGRQNEIGSRMSGVGLSGVPCFLMVCTWNPGNIISLAF